MLTKVFGNAQNMNTQNKKIKLFLSLNNSRVSGIENFVLLVIKYINRIIFDITVALPFKGEMCSELDRLGIKYIIFDRKNHKPYSLIGIIRLLLHFITHRYDVVHANAGIVPCVLSKLLLMPLSIEHKHGLDFTHEKREQLKGISLAYEKAKKYFADFTLTGCEVDRRFLVEKLGYRHSKVITLYNGIDNTFENENGKIRKDEIVVGTIGRLTYQKAQEYFIRMAALILKKNQGMKIRFEIWGEGKEKETYRKLIQSTGLENNVFLCGYASDRKSVYESLDMFVLPSRYEGIPFVILEAMSAGVPVITSNAGGINEIIRDGDNGILVPREDAESLANAVLKLIDEASFSSRLRKNAFDDYRNYWSFNKTIANLEKIYLSKN